MRPTGNDTLTQGYEYINGTKTIGDFWCFNNPTQGREQCLQARNIEGPNRWDDFLCFADGHSIFCEQPLNYN